MYNCILYTALRLIHMLSNSVSNSVKINVFITSVKIYVLLQRCFQVVVELCRGWRDGAIDISRTASPPKMFKRC